MNSNDAQMITNVFKETPKNISNSLHSGKQLKVDITLNMKLNEVQHIIFMGI